MQFGKNLVGRCFSYRKSPRTSSRVFAIKDRHYVFFETTGVLNLPLVNDRLLFRIACDYASRDGLLKNISDPNAQNESHGSFRASLVAKPTEWLEYYRTFDGHFSVEIPEVSELVASKDVPPTRALLRPFRKACRPVFTIRLIPGRGDLPRTFCSDPGATQSTRQVARGFSFFLVTITGDFYYRTRQYGLIQQLATNGPGDPYNYVGGFGMANLRLRRLQFRQKRARSAAVSWPISGQHCKISVP